MTNSRFYTNVDVIGSTVYLREVVDGVRSKRKLRWEPTLYLKDPKGEFKTLYGDNARAVKPGSISETRDFVKKYADASNFEVYGQTNYALQFMGEYGLTTEWSMKYMTIFSLDIETELPESGFPKPELAEAPVNVITVQDVNTERCFTFSTLPKPANCDYTNFYAAKDEAGLLKAFLMFWSNAEPDAITGWNIEKFDCPYLINRITKVLGEEYTAKLSPWGQVSIELKKNKKGKLETSFEIVGVQIMDYMELMKKFTYGNRASWSLGAVCQEELGETKLENPGKDFRDFYTNYPDTFIEYNVKDSRLVTKLDRKMKMLELAITIAYLARINFQEVYSPVKMWDNILYTRLMEKGIVIPQRKSTGSDGSIEGAYVKDPITGIYRLCASLDATSLYPSIMMLLNLSPETYLGKIDMTVDQLLEGHYPDFLQERNVSMGANGTMYDKSKLGIIPEIIADFMAKRKSAKKDMLNTEQVAEDHKKAGEEIPEAVSAKIASLDNLQMAFKIAMNALYGAMANAGFRFFEPDVAESITLTGQLFLRNIEKYVDNDINKAFGITGKKYLFYIDTDSVYFSLEPIIDKFMPTASMEKKIAAVEKITAEKLTPIVGRITQEVSKNLNVYADKINFKQEIAADQVMMFGKKMYVCRVFSSEGVRYAKPKFKTMGIAMVRSGTPKAIQDALRDALPIMFDGGESETQKYILKVRESFDKLGPDEVAKVSGANNIDDYASGTNIYAPGCPIHVRAALLHNYHVNMRGLTQKYKMIGDGDKVKFIFLKKPNPVRENVIAWNVDDKMPEEFLLRDYIDWDTQFDKVFKDAMRNMMNPIGWTTEEVSNLSEFF